MRLFHTLEPFYNNNSKVLILGSFPSPKSREVNFYYGHPQNKFWKVLSSVLNEELPETIDDKKKMLYRNKIALWDVLASCEIKGADDASIKNEVPNDMNLILNSCDIRVIFTTGGTAYRLYNKYFSKEVKIPCFALPSTSPANCRITLNELTDKYNIISKHI